MILIKSSSVIKNGEKVKIKNSDIAGNIIGNNLNTLQEYNKNNIKMINKNELHYYIIPLYCDNEDCIEIAANDITLL